MGDLNFPIAPFSDDGRILTRRQGMIFAKTDQAFQKTEKILTIISWVVALCVTMMIVMDIVLRFIFDYPLPASWEISEVSMPCIVFFPFAYTLSIDAHVRVSLLKDRVSPKTRIVFSIFTNVISFALCVMLTYWSWLRFLESYKMGEEILAAIRIPWWPGKLAMPIAMGVFAARFLFLAFNAAQPKDLTAKDSAPEKIYTT